MACLFLSTLVLQYSVRTTHHGMFICLVRQYCSDRYGQLITACLFAQYVSTVVLGTDNSSRLVLHFFSALVRQYLSTRYGQLIMACLFAQYVSTVVLGTDNSLRRVLHLFSALVCQYLSTWQRHLIIACSSFVQCLSTLLPQYSEQTLATARLFAQYVSTVVLNTDNSSRLVLHFFSALVRQYLSTRNRHSPRHVSLLSTLHRKKHLIPKLGISKKFPKLNPNNGYYMGICMKFPK